MAVANQDRQTDAPGEPEPGDWDAAEVGLSPDQARQYVTLYESLQEFDERSAVDRVRVPRLAFAGADDEIVYGARWDNARVAIGAALVEHRDELLAAGWTVTIVPGAGHTSAMQAHVVLPILVPWLLHHAVPERS